MLLTATCSVADWLAAAAGDEDWATAAAATARTEGLTAAVLLATTTEAEAAAKLQLLKFGHKRKLWLLLKPSIDAAALDVHSALPVAEPSAPPSAADAGMDVDEVVGSSQRPSSGCEDALTNEAFALGNVQWVCEKLSTALTDPRNDAWARGPMREAKLAELTQLRKHKGLPGVHIVVCGNTGAGKSTLLNALLDETSVLPTNGMRACTACLIELAYDESDASDAPVYRGEVEFLSEAEWHKELDDLLDDLTATDGPNAGRVSLSVSEDAPSHGSWCKLWAVYGEHFTHSRERTEEFGPGNRRIYKDPTLESLKAKLLRTRGITQSLGSTHTVAQSSALPLCVKHI